MRFVSTLTILIFSFALARAQDKDNLSSVDIYGSLRFRLAEFDGNYEVQDNLSRIGVDLSYELENGLTVLGRSEWQVNLVDNSAEFNVGSASGAEFGRLTAGDEPLDTFVTRLGYLGLSHVEFGTLTFGKQWSVYYDVSEYTDWFNVFGAQATGTYNAGTAGGVTGTGRAEKAVIYRNQVGNLLMAGQIQLKGDTDNDIDGYSFSARYGFGFGLSLGVAHNRAQLDEGSIELVGLNDDPSATILGIKYEKGPLRAAFTYTNQDNNETVDVADVTVVYDGIGLEFYTHYYWTENLRLMAGFNYLNPDDLDPRVDEDFELKYYVLGAAYYFTRNAFAFAEGKIDVGTDQTGEDRFDVFMVGMRADFSLTR